MADAHRPLRIINCVAPIRICDNGGWTDTWFAKSGKIFNIGVYPYVEVQMDVFKNRRRGTADHRLMRRTTAQSFAVHGAESRLGPAPAARGGHCDCMKRPVRLWTSKVTIFSEAPSGRLDGHFRGGGGGAGRRARPAHPGPSDGRTRSPIRRRRSKPNC